MTIVICKRTGHVEPFAAQVPSRQFMAIGDLVVVDMHGEEEICRVVAPDFTATEDAIRSAWGDELPRVIGEISRTPVVWGDEDEV